MRNIAIYALGAVAILAGCREQQDSGAGNDLLRSAETRTGAAENISATPSRASLGEPVPAEQAKTIMDERHENYERIGDAMKVISRELKSDSPDLSQVRRNADITATLAPQVPGWFPPGTGPDAGRTEAKAEIWERPEDFLAKAKAFEQAAKQFQAATLGGDLAAIRAAQSDLGKSCKACHDLYREEH